MSAAFGLELQGLYDCARIAREPILGVLVTPEQVALCMIQLKIARAMNGWQRDSLVDIAGYAGCAHIRGIE